MEKEITKVVITTVEILPCIKCGSEKVEIWNCGYSSFNVAGGLCKSCGHGEEWKGADWNEPERNISEFWNRRNNPDILIAEYQQEIAKHQEAISELRKMKRKLSKKK
jgi:ribosomal protein L37E